MIVAVNRTQGRAANDAGQFSSGVDLADPSMQPLLARIGQNICPFSRIDRVEHAKNIAAAVVEAKRRTTR